MAHILVIDDDLSIREFISLALEDEGYQVQTAEHGGVALQMIALHPPQLILLDLKMPVMDGFEFLRVYCQMKAPVPVIVFTASRQLSERSLCMNEVLAKPFNLDQILTLVKKYVPNHATND